MTHVGELADQGFWQSVGEWIWNRLPARLRAFLAARFLGISRSEAWGYVVWSAMGVVVGVPEIWAAASGDGFYWPTISSTVGHLEDLVDVVAIIPVAAIAVAAYSVLRHRDSELTLQADQTALARTPEGRLTRADVSVDDLRAGKRRVDQLERRPLAAVPYFAGGTLVIIAGSVVAAQVNDKWILAYVLYGLIAVFWILVPNWLAYFKRTDIPFTTLFVTVRCLERRFHAVALIVAAGIAVLLIHLALYPWPDLARTSASYAGLTSAKAESKAKRELSRVRAGKPGLAVSAKHRGIAHGRDAWFVYFAPDRGTYRGCVVTVTRRTASVAHECRA